jgi:MFS transporter, MCT family, solute carrier family 16 (monocarboxylic acid transporters), member 10
MQSVRRIETWIDKEALKRWTYRWYVVGVLFLFFGLHAVFFNLEEWAAYMGFGNKCPGTSSPCILHIGQPGHGPKELRHDAMETYWLLAIMNLTSAVGRISAGFLGDTFGALQTSLLAQCTIALLVLLWIFASNVKATIAFAVIFGSVSGAVVQGPAAVVAHFLEHEPEGQAKFGQWAGMMFSMASIPALTGPLIAGFLISHYDNFVTVQLWCLVSFVLSAACMAIALYYDRRERIRRRAKSKREPTNVTDSSQAGLEESQGEAKDTPEGESRKSGADTTSSSSVDRRASVVR